MKELNSLVLEEIKLIKKSKTHYKHILMSALSLICPQWLKKKIIKKMLDTKHKTYTRLNREIEMIEDDIRYAELTKEIDENELESIKENLYAIKGSYSQTIKKESIEYSIQHIEERIAELEKERYNKVKELIHYVYDNCLEDWLYV